jgi:glycosyltransferase 2 family protein
MSSKTHSLMGSAQDSEGGITGIMGCGNVLAKFDDLDVEDRRVCQENRLEVRSSPAEEKSLRPLLLGVVRILVSMGLLVFILSQVDLDQTIEVARKARPVLLLVLLVIFVFERFLCAYRWYLLIRCRHGSIGFATVLKATFVSGFLGNFLPGIIGIEAIRIVAMARSTADLAMSFSSVLLDRILGVVALILLLSLALAVVPKDVPIVISLCAWTILGVLILGCFLLMRPWTRALIDGVLGSLLFYPLRAKLRKLYLCLDAFRNRAAVVAWAAVLAVFFQLIRVGISPVAGMALGIDIPLVYYFVYVPIITFLIMLPISVGGLGVREAAFVYFFGSEHMSPEAAFTLSLLIYAFTVISQLPGAVFCVTGIKPKKEG